MPSESTLRLAVRFGERADPKRPYLYDCQLLGHEDAGMMTGQFLIVQRGTEAKVSSEHGLPEPDGE